MKYYISIDTGEIYTKAEIENDYEMFKNEMLGYADFNDYFENMLSLGRERVGGFVECENSAIVKLYDYIAHDVAGVPDDMRHDYLTLNAGRDGNNYYYYIDECNCVAVNVETLEIITDPDKLDDLFS